MLSGEIALKNNNYYYYVIALLMAFLENALMCILKITFKKRKKK